MGEEEFETNHPSWNARDRAGRGREAETQIGYISATICLFVCYCLYFLSKVLMPLLIILFFSWLALFYGYCISSSAFYNVPNER